MGGVVRFRFRLFAVALATVFVLLPLPPLGRAGLSKKVVYVYRLDVSGLRADVSSAGGDEHVQATAAADWSARWPDLSILVDGVMHTVSASAVTTTDVHGDVTVKGSFQPSPAGPRYSCGPKYVPLGPGVLSALPPLLVGGDDLGGGRLGLSILPSPGYTPGIQISCSAGATEPVKQVQVRWDAFAGTQR